MGRLKLWKRIVILGAAAWGAVGLLLMMLDVFGAGVMSAMHSGLINDAGRVRAGALILLLMLFAALAALILLTVVIALQAGKARGARLLSLSDQNGDGVLLTQETLDQLLEDALGLPDGVSITDIQTDYRDREVAVTVEITVSSNVNIPEVTRAMQARVRQQLTDKSGIPVSSVDIKVMRLHVELNDMWASPDPAPAAPGEDDETIPWEGLKETQAQEPLSDRPTRVFEPVRLTDETENH